MHLIRKAGESDIALINSIADEQLGKGYLRFTLADLTTESCRTTVCENEGKVVGFCICIAPAKDYTAIGIPEDAFLIKTLAVRPNDTGKGIGSQLIKHCFSYSENFPNSPVYYLRWKKESDTHLDRFLDKFGFEQCCVVEDYWKQDSINKNYVCPECGPPPCSCPAMIYSLPN